MSLKVRAVLVVVIGLVMGLSLSVGGGLIGNSRVPDKEDLALEQARLFAEVLERVKRDYVERATVRNGRFCTDWSTNTTRLRIRRINDIPRVSLARAIYATEQNPVHFYR